MRKLYALAVFVLFFTTNIYAQDITVSGKVTDSEDGTELPGVSILIKGTAKGTITDFEGNYSIDAPSNATLVFNYLGYQSQEIPVVSQTSINVQMSTETEILEEVVVVGYGVVEKGDVTGVIKKVDEEQFNKGVIASPDQLISGKVSGVQVTNNSGEPGGQATVKIRGGTSLGASNNPLYVIDGVPIDNSGFNPGGKTGRNPLNFINPNEIENITVLKDASAAAIYGSRAANGVIIITTKGGGIREGKASEKPTVTYDGNVAVSSFPGDIPILSPDEFRSAIAAFDDDNIDNPNVIGPSDTDWFNEITQTAVSQQHNISMGANIEDGNYRFSTGYQQINGILKNSKNERYSINFNLSKGLFDNDLTLRFSTKNGITRDKFASNQVGAALAFNPTQPIFYDSTLYSTNPANITGEFGGYTEYNNPLTTANPVAQIERNKDEGRGYRSISNFEFTYKLPFIDGLTIKNNFGYDFRSEDRVTFNPSFLKTQANTNGYYFFERGQRESFLYEGYLEYKREIESIDAKFSVLGGYSFQSFANSFATMQHDDLSTDAFGVERPATTDESIIDISLNQLDNRLISFFGRANFDFKDKYLVTATLRRDGSSRFSPSNRWGLFPSVAAAWRVSNESFYEGIKGTINYMKLRFGYGVNGNQEIEDYLYIRAYELGDPSASYQLGDQFYLTARPTAVDPNIKWEETSSLNLGLDWEVFRGKLAGSFELYQKNTDDLLFTINIPVGINVGDRILTNIGELRTRGFEIELTSPILTEKEYTWQVTANASYNQNEVIRLDNTVPGLRPPDFETGGIQGDVGQNIQLIRVGERANSFFAFEQLYDDAGNPIYDNLNRENMYKDQNDDGQINEEDLRIFDNPDPDWILGLTSLFNYRRVDCSFTFRAQIGNYVYNNFSSNYGELNRLSTGTRQNIHTSALETGFEVKQLKSDYYIENASFLRLDNVTVGYTFDEVKWMRMRVYATVQNLFVITGYSGFDPEIPNGIDNNLYPRARTYLGGLTLNF